MLIEILKRTYEGIYGPIEVGDKIQVYERTTRKGIDKETADRWIKRGIAKLIVEEPKPDKKADVVAKVDAEEVEIEAEPQGPEVLKDETNEDEEETNIDEMTNKQLYALCKQKGFDALPKKSRNYYLAFLGEAADVSTEV